MQTRAISTLDGIFPNPYYVSLFGKDDLQVYFERLASVGISITSKIKQQLHFYCGGHPYLLEMFGYEMAEYFRQKQRMSTKDTFDKIRPFCNHYFDNITRRLRDDQKLDKLLQVVFGPVLDITQADIDELQGYSLIKENPDWKSHFSGTRLTSAYICFAASFQSYLRSLGANMGLMPVLIDTEKALRCLILTELHEKHGEQWVEVVEQRFPSLFKECRAIQDTDRQAGYLASQNLLDYTYLSGLVTIILFDKYWNGLFQQIFHAKNKAYWQERMHLISKTRNAVMHARIEVVPESRRSLCKEFCEEILQTVNVYLSKIPNEKSV